MGSEQNEGTRCQPSSEPRPCANDCGFWGRSDTMDLCSNCYKQFQMKQSQAALAKSALEKSLAPNSSSLHDAPELPVPVDPSLSLSQQAVDSVLQKMQNVKNRCRACNKKVGLIGFKCKCGWTFCGDHRYPEKHECPFDFKSVGRKDIAKANPLVKADKLERI